MTTVNNTKSTVFIFCEFRCPIQRSYIILTTVNLVNSQFLFDVNLVCKTVAILPMMTVICTEIAVIQNESYPGLHCTVHRSTAQSFGSLLTAFTVKKLYGNYPTVTVDMVYKHCNHWFYFIQCYSSFYLINVTITLSLFSQ